MTRSLVPLGYRVFNPWYMTRAEIASLGRGVSFSRDLCKQDYRRDWSEDELIEISSINDNHKYVHNHSKNWPQSVFTEYKNKGFFTFSFIRNPIDVICSMYFFLSEKPGHPSDPAWGYEDLGTLDEFVTNNCFNLDRLIPEYYSEIDFFEVFSDDSFSKLLNKIGLNYFPSRKLNQSSNKGCEFYLKENLLSQNAVDLVKNTKFWDIYKGIV